jgi:hypothetical protein
MRERHEKAKQSDSLTCFGKKIAKEDVVEIVIVGTEVVEFDLSTRESRFRKSFHKVLSSFQETLRQPRENGKRKKEKERKTNLSIQNHGLESLLVK